MLDMLSCLICNKSMRFVLYFLFAIAGLLGLSNVLAIFGSGSPITIIGLVQGLFVLLGSILLLVSIFSYAKNKPWKRNVAYLGVGLTFVTGLISLMGGPAWVVQLIAPIVILVFLFIV